jgi:hypothetical protein
MFGSFIPPDIPTQPIRRNDAPDQWDLDTPDTVSDSVGTITVKVPPGTIIDTSYNEGTVACRQSRKGHPSASTTVPAGIYIELRGHDSRCVIHGVAVGTLFNAKTHELSDYSLSAILACGNDCDVSLKAWIKLRPRLPSDVVVESPPNPTPTPNAIVSSREPPRGPALSQSLLNTAVARSDLGSQYQLKVTFVAPAPLPGAPAPYDLIQIYCYQRFDPNKPILQIVPYSTFPDIRGKWKPGESVAFTIDVPKQYSDPANGWKVRFTVCRMGARCVAASPNLLTIESVQ